MIRSFLRKITGNPTAVFDRLVLFPVAITIILFAKKILSLKNFTLGDDFQQLALFHPGRIAYPMVDLIKYRIVDGRFFPLFYQDFNLVSLLSADLTFNNLAERCFYVQAGMWVLASTFFFALMVGVARVAACATNAKSSVWLQCFIPLSFLALLFTPAMVSYFMMLVFPETLLCVFLPAFLLFYGIGYWKDSAIGFALAFVFATLALYCKENTFVVLVIIAFTWLVFGWKQLSRKHRAFLFALIGSVAAFLALYYFVVYRHAVTMYNQDRLWGVSMMTHLANILKSYPVYLLAFFVGFIRAFRVVALRDRRHLFADAVLFSALGLFLSFLALKLVDWWYWGTGTVLIFPVLFYWVLVYKKPWGRILLFTLVAGCFSLSARSACRRMTEIDYDQKADMPFVRKIEQNATCRRISLVSFTNRSYIDECMLGYLRQFMTHLGTADRWRNNITMTTELPEKIGADEIFIIRQGIAPSADFSTKMARNAFQCVCECSYFKMYAHVSTLPHSILTTLSTDGSTCRFSGCWDYEESSGGRWLIGRESEIVVNLQLDPQREVLLALKGFACLQNETKENAATCFVNGSKIQELSFRSDTFVLPFRIPAGTLVSGENRITLRFREAHAPSEWGGSDSRPLVYFVKAIDLSYVDDMQTVERKVDNAL